MFFDELRQWVTENAFWFGGLTFFGGLVGGHWLTLGRDRRKEFNDMVEVPVTGLRRQLSGCRDRRIESIVRIPVQDLEGYMPTWQRRRFRFAVLQYQQFHQSCADEEAYDPATSSTIKASAASFTDLAQVVEELLRRLKRR